MRRKTREEEKLLNEDKFPLCHSWLGTCPSRKASQELISRAFLELLRWRCGFGWLNKLFLKRPYKMNCNKILYPVLGCWILCFKKYFCDAVVPLTWSQDWSAPAPFQPWGRIFRLSATNIQATGKELPGTIVELAAPLQDFARNQSRFHLFKKHFLRTY